MKESSVEYINKTTARFQEILTRQMEEFEDNEGMINIVYENVELSLDALIE